MDLILWRHAEAEDGEPDTARMLTARGVRQAGRMGKWLDTNLPDTCRIFASPAKRTMQTAQALGRPFKQLDALAPGRTVDDILAAVRWPDARGSVLIVGHQPVLGLIAARLIANVDQAWTIRKANVWWICQRDKEAHAPDAKPFPAPVGSSRTGDATLNYLHAVLGPGHIGTTASS